MERWIMNRIGFLNFWLYDDEEFPFKDGKLLLRGSNGSGKSITTQSFIPFILDGNRSPERLDPFGTRDRKMDFYILGSDDDCKDDSTGYLFMEFKKPSTQQYRTIGIGLHARKNSPMLFWGFCVLDNRRIGYDLKLYNEAGKSKIPLSKIEMRNRIGDGGIFVETSGDYKEMVNHELFGFPDSKTYDQFISLLIKVRAPKLSKDSTKPAEVYKILNASLQTLTQDDLRAMVDSMEKIENLQNQLDDSKNALVEGKRLSDEYDRYNRYVLGKKADAYLTRHAQAKTYRTKSLSLDSEFEREKTASKSDTARLEEAKLEENESKTKLSSLSHHDIKQKNDERSAAILDLKAEQESKLQKLAQQSLKKDKLDNYYQDKKAASTSIYNLEYELSGEIKKLNEFEEFTPPLHDYYMKSVENLPDFYTQKHQISKDLEAYRIQIAEARDAFKEQKAAQKLYDLQSQEYDRLKLAYDKEKSEFDLAVSVQNGVRDEIIEGYYRAQKENKLFVIDDSMRENLEKIISNYGKSSTYSELAQLLSSHRDPLQNKLDVQMLKSKNDESKLISEHGELLEKLKLITNTPDPVPERSAARVFARTKLLEKNIPFRSFYECADFADNLDDNRKALLEEQLRDMGILDAIVVSKTDRKAAKKALSELSDCLIESPESSCKFPLAQLFKVTEKGEIANEITRILNSVSTCADSETFQESDSIAAIYPDGTYKNGVIFGHSIPTSPSCFIGVQARSDFKATQIAQITELLRLKQLELDTNKSQILSIEAQMDTLLKEFKSLPNIGDLDAANILTSGAKTKMDFAFTSSTSQYSAMEEAKNAYEACRNKTTILSKNFPFRKTLEEYENAIHGILDYSSSMQDVLNLLEQKQNANAKLFATEENIESVEQDLDQIDSELHQIELRIRRYSGVISLCDEFLNRQENRDIAEQIKTLSAQLVELNNEISALQMCQGEHKVALQKLSEKIEENRVFLLQKDAEEEKFSSYFEEELCLNLVLTQAPQKLLDCAKLCADNIKPGDEKHPMQTMQSRLEELFQSRTGALTSHYLPELRDHFDTVGSEILRTRKIIHLTWAGKKIPPAEFVEELKRDIQLKETIIREEDENLFKDVLSDTLSKKLYSKINESIRWVSSMSATMKDIDTSMDLKFSLDWKPRRDMFEGEITFAELDSLLAKDSRLLRTEDFQKVSNHFRSKIALERQKAEEAGEQISYPELVSSALDYRNWFEFKLNFKRGDDPKKELTSSVFNQFSGGERAMAMYVPLFAAVSSQYKKADEQCPFMIALDEAFAGVDEQNISSMFALVEELGFGYIMNSQSLWGCYKTVSSLEIAELYRPANAQYITVILYQWNGVQKILDTGV